MPRALKVFRTPIGFHDAYIAASSQKAALAAWGSDANLFARGVAEVVSDPALTAEPLANPGKIIKRSRGSNAEHFKALPTNPTKRSTEKRAAKPSAALTKPALHHARPSRSKLAAAETALSKSIAVQAAALAEFKAREDKLRADRKRVEARQARERQRLEDRVAHAKSEYDAALARWRSDD